MPHDLLAPLRARRKDIQTEMKIRLDELDQMIARVSESTTETTQSDNGSRSRRRGKETTIGDIIERPILDALLVAAEPVTTKKMAGLVQGRRMGPLVSAWHRRASAAGFVFEALVEKSMTPDGEKAFSLTPEGRHVFGSVAQT